jgi:hypothetical protein
MFFTLTRQFPSAGSGQALPGYFHSPLPGLNRGSPPGIAMLQPTVPEAFSASANAFMT